MTTVVEINDADAAIWDDFGAPVDSSVDVRVDATVTVSPLLVDIQSRVPVPMGASCVVNPNKSTDAIIGAGEVSKDCFVAKAAAAKMSAAKSKVKVKPVRRSSVRVPISRVRDEAAAFAHHNEEVLQSSEANAIGLKEKEREVFASVEFQVCLILLFILLQLIVLLQQPLSLQSQSPSGAIPAVMSAVVEIDDEDAAIWDDEFKSAVTANSAKVSLAFLSFRFCHFSL